jgi:uncharacterized protein YkwD
MRKHLVVVGVAASAVLLAGGIAATAAGAQETPDFPDVPGFSLPELPGLPQFPDGTGLGGDDGPADPADQADPADPAGAGDRADADHRIHSGGQGDQAGPGDQADLPAAGAPAAQRPAPDQAGDDDSTVQRPAGQRPGGQQAPAARPDRQQDREVPVKQRPALAQQPAAFLVDAARENVTAADVSSSPNSPVQQQVLALVNLNRRRGGCDGLSLDRRLIDAANEHAADMARHDYFAHESRNGDGAGDRVNEAGYHWKRYGENIARGADSAYEVVDGWMHSPEHRENILDCKLDQMGIGLAIAGDRTPYWVQDFATPQ